MLNKRKYKITPKKREYGTILKVEMWNDYGMKRTIYSEDVLEASSYVYNYWNPSEKEFNKMNLLHSAIKECVEIDKNNNIINGNYDGLD